MKTAVLGVMVLAVMIGGCRRETPYYEPMKLGASVEQRTDSVTPR